MEKIDKNPELLKLYNMNDEHTKKQIILTLNKRPSFSDGVGWIYGFHRQNDEQNINNFWIKIGRTERNPFTRVEEWNGEMLLCIKTSYHHKLERLIHLFFDFAREPRISEIKEDELSFCQKIYRFFSCKKRSRNQELYKQEIEWFHIKENINVNQLVCQIWKLVEEYDHSSIYHNNIVYVETEKININTATLNELLSIPHVGKVTANKIIALRNVHKFNNINEIKNISKTISTKFDKISKFICV